MSNVDYRNSSLWKNHGVLAKRTWPRPSTPLPAAHTKLRSDELKVQIVNQQKRPNFQKKSYEAKTTVGSYLPVREPKGENVSFRSGFFREKRLKSRKKKKKSFSSETKIFENKCSDFYFNQIFCSNDGLKSEKLGGKRFF